MQHEQRGWAVHAAATMVLLLASITLTQQHIVLLCHRVMVLLPLNSACASTLRAPVECVAAAAAAPRNSQVFGPNWT